MRRHALPATLFAATLLIGCAHAADKTSDMLVYEEARDSKQGEIVRERNPELFAEAQQQYGMALDAHADNDSKLSSHHTRMANIQWRTAEARSAAADSADAKRIADDHFAEANVRLEEAEQRITLATAAVERLEKIAALESRVAKAEGALSSQKDAITAREDVSKAIIAVKEAEAAGAKDYAAKALERAAASLEEATSALERKDLAAARAKAKETMTLAAEAQNEAKPKFEADRGRLAYEARRRALFDAAGKVPGATRKITEGGVVVTLYSLFPSGSVQVPSEKLAVLDSIEDLANGYEDFAIVIEGHTDNRGKHEKNLALSQSRAQTVLTHLSQQGVSPARMTSAGKGADAPVADNRTKAGRAENRRIDVIFVQARAK